MTYNLKPLYDTVSELTTNDKSLSTIYGRRASDGAIVPISIDDTGHLQLSGEVILNVSEITPVNVVQAVGSLLNATANLSLVGGSPLSLGQQLMAMSLPVTIASDQSPIPVTITGTITASNNIDEWGGVATTLGQKTMSASVPITLASDQSPLAVTGTFWQATQPVSIASPVPVTGTFWQTTQPVSGTVTAVPPSLPAVAGFGQAVMATTGTAVQLASNSLVNGVVVTANGSNVAPIVLGSASVTNVTDGTGNGYVLAPGASIGLAVANTNSIWMNGTASDSVSFVGS